MKAFNYPRLTVASLTVLIAIATSSIATAAVYKYIDEDGNVAFGDRPVDGSEKVTIYGASTEKSNDEDSEEGSDGDTSSNGEVPEGGDENQTVYRSLDLLTPKPGKVVDEGSAVQVIFLPTPSLGQADQLVIVVDGKELSKGRDANVSLSKLQNGVHTVSGKIVDADGETKISSKSVTFQVGKNGALAQGDN